MTLELSCNAIEIRELSTMQAGSCYETAQLEEQVSGGSLCHQGKEVMARISRRLAAMLLQVHRRSSQKHVPYCSINRGNRPPGRNPS